MRYRAYQSGQSASRWPIRFSYSPCAASARRSASANSDHAVWRAFRNNAWPALYFVDARGNIRDQHIGEGEYDRSERTIQKLISEAGAGTIERAFVSVDARGAEAAADWSNLRSPETYVGYARAEKFSSPGGLLPDRARVYTAPPQLSVNQWSLSGDWTVGKEAAIMNKANGRIGYRFQARDLHLVMGAATPRKSVRFRVLIDGLAPRTA